MLKFKLNDKKLLEKLEVLNNTHDDFSSSITVIEDETELGTLRDYN